MTRNVMSEYGPKLTHAMVQNFGGEAARSELDTLAEPLKRLVAAQPMAKTWLSEALFNETFPSQKVGPTDKRMWLQKIMR